MCFVLVPLVVSVYGASFVDAETIPNGLDIFANVVRSRQSIQKGHLTLSTVYKDTTGVPVKKKWGIWFDGAKMRSDVEHKGITETFCLNCYSKRTRLYYTTQPVLEQDGKMALTFFDGDSKPFPNHYIPDPRWFGCLSLPIETSQYQFPLEMYGLKPEKYTTFPKVVPERIAEMECWRIDYKIPGDISFSLWVAQADTSRVVRVASDFDVEGTHFIDCIDVETEMRKDGNIWFPTALHYRRTENDIMTCNAETTIKIVSLNEPLPADTFSPKGISFLKPGTPVAWHLDRDRPFPEGELEWDGEQVVLVDEFGKMMRESSHFSPFRIFCILLGLALICIGIGMKLRTKYFGVK